MRIVRAPPAELAFKPVQACAGRPGEGEFPMDSNVTRRNFVGMGAMVAAGMGMGALAAKPAQAHDNS